MQKNSFSSLSVIHLPPSRLLASACCPDKDLVALVSRVGTQERLSLWKLSGTKTWEVDVALGDEVDVVDLAWSPDGRSLAVAHKQNCVTVHSIQDGFKEKTISVYSQSGTLAAGYASIWWFKQDLPFSTTSAPDIFQRDNIITGSSRSIIQTLPLLDYIAEEAQRSTATDLFAFQGSQTRPAAASNTPAVMEEWPALQPNLVAASIDLPGQPHDPQKILDDQDDANVNSLLMVVTESGVIQNYYEGVYPLGSVGTHLALNPMSMYKHPTRPIFFAHARTVSEDGEATSILPVIIELPLIGGRRLRDMASLSTICKDLTWYLMRVVKEMRSLWFGSDTTVAAREIGPKWVRALDAKLKEHGDQKDNNPILDLTNLLLTGRMSPALSDFIGSGEQMSERGLQKWDSTMTDALLKLRDFSEKRIGPACQRIHLVLEEIHGWSHIPEYQDFELPSAIIAQCLDKVNRTIVLAAWLACAARREYARFKEFMLWVKFEVETAAAINAGNDVNTHIEHDILEVNKYFMSGLFVSSIDKWFMGPTPLFEPSDLRGSGSDSLPEALKRAQEVLDNPEELAWDHYTPQKDLNHVDRNIDALVQELVQQLQSIFSRAAGATGRSAQVMVDADKKQGKNTIPKKFITRERSAFSAETGDNEVLQYLAIASLSSEDPNILCLTRVKSEDMHLIPLSIAACLLECYILNEDGTREDFDLLDFDFFDEESLVIIYRPREDEGAFIATVGFHDLGYKELQLDLESQLHGREHLMQETLSRWKNGNLDSAQIPIKRFRRLLGCESGRVTLAVNGRAGRRVACVLDGKGTSMQSLDLESDEDEAGDVSFMSED